MHLLYAKQRTAAFTTVVRVIDKQLFKQRFQSDSNIEMNNPVAESSGKNLPQQRTANQECDARKRLIVAGINQFSQFIDADCPAQLKFLRTTFVPLIFAALQVGSGQVVHQSHHTLICINLAIAHIIYFYYGASL